MRSTNEPERLSGFMLGTMIGDAIGLPFEGVRRQRVAALLRSEPLRHRLLFRYGLVSDDTEHMLMTVIAWQRSGGDVSVFARRLAWQLRLWILSMPPATGLATAKACVKLLLGFPPHRSGVRSAGNGPAMRAGVLGLLCRSDDELRDFSLAVARITHRDERAEHGALAVAIAARAASDSPSHAAMLDAFGVAFDRLLPEGQMRVAIDDARASVDRGESTEEFASALGCERGVTGFVMHTVPVVLHLWMSGPATYREGVERMIRLGGDTDTTGAILGGLLGARPSTEQMPEDWLAGVRDFPITPALIRRIAQEAASDSTSRVRTSWRWLVRLPRNVVFFAIVLIHAMRRVFPPYGGVRS